MLSGETMFINFIGLGTFAILAFGASLAVMLIVFLYKASALYTLAKKLGTKYAFLAWIPFAQFFIYPLLADEKWGWGLIAILPIILPFMFLPFTVIPFVNLFLILLISIGIVTFFAFRTYWIWKIFEKRNYPGALSLLNLVNFVYLIVLGIVAWIDKTKIKKKNFQKKKTILKKPIKKKISK